MKTRHLIATAFILVAASGPAAAQKYAAAIQPTTPLPTFCAGKTAKVSVSLANNGVGPEATWTTNIYHLSYHWKQGGVVVIYDGLKTSLPANVPAGGHVSVSATVQAPGAPGSWELVFDMAADGVGWFEWFGSKSWSQTVTVENATSCLNQVKFQSFSPKITKCSAFTKPGFFVLCEGTNFGSTAGKILMKGIPGNPDQELWAGPGAWGSRVWTDTGIFVNVPKDLAGFRQTQVKIQIVNALNQTSSDVPIRLDPLLDYAMVTDGIKVTACTAPLDECDIGPSWNVTTKPSLSIWGGKFPNHHGRIRSDGTDGYDVSVGPDFVLDRYEFCGNDDTYCTSPKVTKFADGTTSASFTVKWNTNIWGDEVQYVINIYAYGPRGVSPH